MSKSKGKPATNKPAISDLADPAKDEEKLRSEETILDLPDVKDIPGQEFVHPPDLREFADTTIASSDEEGDRIWEESDVAESTDVSPLEKRLLDQSANDMPTRDDQALRRASLDETDDEGDPLNERVSANAVSGSDLDVPGADEDDQNEDIGEEDEENNPYSLGGDENSVNEERSGV